MLRRSANGLIVLVALTLFLLSTAPPTEAATVPANFADGFLATGLSVPTAMAFAPDGRIFVTQQTGALRVIKNGSLLPTPFVTLTVDSSGERGLLGVAFDPAFNSNRFVYLYYTATTPAIHNRISRFTANGDVAVPGSEVVIIDVDNLSTAQNHNGGAIHFGPDGKLYAAVGENANGANSQTLANLLGKMLRINSDGTIPTDNPFFNTATGKNRAIWALGLRNPFTFAFQPGTGRMFINDVGQNLFEEINDGIVGSNYGWPTTEGPTNLPQFRTPLFFYGHGSTANTGCAITGGTFYNPSTPNFPSSYTGKYFYADLCSGWIRVLDPVALTDAPFATGITNPVDLQVGPDGALYYVAYGSGAIGRISFSSTAHAIDSPNAGVNPQDFTVGGWAIDRAATANTGVDMVHVYVYAADAAGNITGGPQFLGPASFFARPDIAALNGPQFLNSGFTRNVTALAAGTYQLAVYTHSSVSGVWDLMLRFLQVQAPVTNPLGAIDGPAALPATVGQSFTVTGWAIDKGAPAGTGVDLVHVYVYPTDANGNVTGAAQFLGQASYGGSRPDIGSLHGARFMPSAFALAVNNLAPGRYQLTAFAHSTLTGNWNVHLRSINAVGPQTQPLIAIDTPQQPNTLVGPTFLVNGWAIDRGAPTGTGVDAVHIYAYPADANGNPTGAPPFFLGGAAYGGTRPDVGGLFGAQFTPSAYTMNASGLSPGNYLLAVYARSTVTNTYNLLTRPIRR